MADFAAVLRKTIDGLKENTPEARRKVYDKARSTIEAKLAAINPPPPAQLADRQRKLLEEAIAGVEADYAAPAVPEPQPEPEDEFDRILADLDPRTVRPAPQAAPSIQAVPPLQPAAGTEPPVESTPGRSTPFGPEHFEGEARAEIPPYEDERHEPGVAPAAPDRPRRGFAGMIAALVVLLAIAGAAYGFWFHRDTLENLPGVSQVMALINGSQEGAQKAATEETPADTDVASRPADSGEKAEAPSENETPAPAAETKQAEAKPQKFTQRLTADGEEVDEGPAGGEAGVGEGTSIASATEMPASGEAAPEASGQASAGAEQQVPVSQKAIFYEERTTAAQGSAETGTVVWSLVRESPGDDLPPEPAIRAEATIPGKNLQLRLTIRRNGDQSLPASHIVEMIFLTPDDFPGGGIDNVLRIAMKHSEQDTGNPLLGIPAKIADGFFLFALNDTKADEQINLLLLKRQEWIDIPIVYKSGRRALITMEKGLPGDKVFDQALEAWTKETSG